MMCVRSPHYVILVNGVPTGKINPSRGIWQEPNLSIFVSNLCRSFEFLIGQGRQRLCVKGRPFLQGGPCLNNLFFVDDSLLFVE